MHKARSVTQSESTIHWGGAGATLWIVVSGVAPASQHAIARILPVSHFTRSVEALADLVLARPVSTARIVTVVFAALARWVRGVSFGGAIAGAAVCFLLYVGAGSGAFVALVSVFALTWISTRFGYRRKEKLGTAEKRDGRTALQVLANLAVAAICAAVSMLLRERRFFCSPFQRRCRRPRRTRFQANWARLEAKSAADHHLGKSGRGHQRGSEFARNLGGHRGRSRSQFGLRLTQLLPPGGWPFQSPLRLPAWSRTAILGALLERRAAVEQRRGKLPRHFDRRRRRAFTVLKMAGNSTRR